MITVRHSEDRGHTQLGWLDSRHSFSFDQYYDPRHVSFRSLRVINEDWVAPGAGFPTHPHRDMEIITYVLAGALQHGDSMGNGSLIRPGEVQRMSAGTGITHSEFNASKTERVHLLQIWILPARLRLEPSYEQKVFPREKMQGAWQRLAAPSNGHSSEAGTVAVHQDVELYATQLNEGAMVSYEFKPGRFGWVQVAGGLVNLGEAALRAGDGAAISEEHSITLTGAAEVPAEVLLFDLA